MKLKNYEIYNGFDSRILEDNCVIEAAKNGRDAAIKFLNKMNIKFRYIKCSASNSVIIKTTPFKYIDGMKCPDGRISWWEVH